MFLTPGALAADDASTNDRAGPLPFRLICTRLDPERRSVGGAAPRTTRFQNLHTHWQQQGGVLSAVSQLQLHLLLKESLLVSLVQQVSLLSVTGMAIDKVSAYCKVILYKQICLQRHTCDLPA